MESRRVITVPIDKKAEEDLDIDRATPDQLIELYLSESDYDYLFKEKVFEKINNVCDSWIAGYEYAGIKGEEPLRMLKNLLISIASHDKSELIKKLLSLVEKAVEFKTSIHFFF